MNGREVVSYLRVSTEMQGLGGLGIAAQRNAVARFVAAYGCEFVAEYAEVETGRKEHLRNRPQLVLAVAHARRSGALLVIARFDRLARSVLVTSQLLESGVEFVACDNPHANRLTIHILAAMAEYEGKIISDRTKAGLAAARERGVVFSRPGRSNLSPEARSKGQQAAKIAHNLRAREAYADLVPLMRTLRESRHSMQAIADKLNEMGHRNQRKHRWSQSNVRAVFFREGLGHLSNIPGLTQNITPEIQRMGATRAAELSRAKTKAAYAHLEPGILARHHAGDHISVIVRDLNANGHKTQGGGRFSPSIVRAMLTRLGVAPLGLESRGFKPWYQGAATQAATAAKLRRAVKFRAKHLPLALKLRESGMTLNQIAAEFNRRRRKTSRSKRWNYNSIWVLINVVYAETRSVETIIC